jgi:uroporphyrinogen-III synthase
VRLIVTRPQDDAVRTAAALAVRGHAAVISPVLAIAPIADAAIGPGPWRAIAVTSANAVAAMRSHPRLAALQSYPVFAVGSRTADAARAAGFTQVTAAGGDLTDLVAVIARALPPGADPVLYLAGETRSGDLAAALAPHKVTTEMVVVYRAVPVSRLSASAAALLRAGEVDGVLHYSRRSAAAFLAAADGDGVTAALGTLRHFCLSEQVAEPLRAAGLAAIAVAARPQENELLALLDS